MLTVKELVRALDEPKKLTLLLGMTEIQLVSEMSEKIEPETIDIFGDYAIETLRANAPHEYTAWVLTRPVKATER